MFTETDLKFISDKTVRGLNHYYNGVYNLAIDCFTDALVRSEEYKINPDHYFMRGLCYYYLEKFDEAYIDFTAAKRINPSFHLTYYYRIKILINEEWFNDALNDYKKLCNMPLVSNTVKLDESKDLLIKFEWSKDPYHGYKELRIVQPESDEIKTKIKEVEQLLQQHNISLPRELFYDNCPHLKQWGFNIVFALLLDFYNKKYNLGYNLSLDKDKPGFILAPDNKKDKTQSVITVSLFKKESDNDEIDADLIVEDESYGGFSLKEYIKVQTIDYGKGGIIQLPAYASRINYTLFTVKKTAADGTQAIISSRRYNLEESNKVEFEEHTICLAR